MIRRSVLPVLAAVWLAFAPATAHAQSCDEACLTDIANRYMDALVRHDPKGLPWAERVGYAENGVKLRIGEGTWATIDARGKSPVVVADPEQGRVAWIGAINDHGQPAFYAMDMRIERGKIAAVDAVIRRREGRQPFGDPVTFVPDVKFGAKLAKAAVTSRNQMTGLVEGYFNSQAMGDGTVLTQFGEGCRVIENGVAMAGNLPAGTDGDPSCEAALQRGLLQEYESVRRMIVAVDEARGLVVALGRRDLPAAAISFTARDGKTYPAEAKYPRTVGFVSLFKIEGGKIVRIESTANELPYLMPSSFAD